jgi:hypothetical protein
MKVLRIPEKGGGHRERAARRPAPSATPADPPFRFFPGPR